MGLFPTLVSESLPLCRVESKLWLDLFKNDMEREDEEGRLPAPWDREEGAGGQEGGRRKSKKERNRRRSMKVHSKDKIGNIDINVLQRELCNEQLRWR